MVKKMALVLAVLLAQAQAQINLPMLGVGSTVSGGPTASIVQSNGNVNSSGSSTSVSLSATGTGHAIIVTTLGGTGTFVISDNQLNTYLQVSGAQATLAADTEFSDIWYCLTCTSGVTSVTVSGTGSAFIIGTVYEVTNLVSLDGTGQHISNGTIASNACTGPSITASFSDLLIATGDADNGFSAVASPWTFSNPGPGSVDAFIINSSTGAFQPVFTSVGSTSCLVSAAAFKI